MLILYEVLDAVMLVLGKGVEVWPSSVQDVPLPMIRIKKSGCPIVNLGHSKLFKSINYFKNVLPPERRKKLWFVCREEDQCGSVFPRQIVPMECPTCYRICADSSLGELYFGG